MRVVILTEGGSGIGYGHMARCLSLLQSFDQAGHHTQLIVHTQGDVGNILAGQSFLSKEWKTDKALLKLIAAEADIVVVDSYLAGRSCYDALISGGAAGVFVDDYQRIAYPAGIIVNFSAAVREDNYPGVDPRCLLLGPGYAAIRREYWDVPQAKVPDRVSRVLVMLGGANAGELMNTVVDHIRQFDPSWACTAVVTRNFAEPSRAALKGKTDVACDSDAAQLCRLMMTHDLAVSAGGQTLYELARVGLPTAALVIADNQRPNVQGFARAGFVLNVEGSVQDGFAPGLPGVLNTLRSKDIRRECALKGQTLVDGKGGARVVEHAARTVKGRQ